MIKRISKEQDFKDYIVGCAAEVLQGIKHVKYYTEGYKNSSIDADFSVVGDSVQVFIDREVFSSLPNGVLYRRVECSYDTEKYDDGSYDFVLEDCMNVWLGEDESSAPDPQPQPVPGDVYTKAQTDALLDEKADKEYVDDTFVKKTDEIDAYTKSETDALLDAKADKEYVDDTFVKKTDEIDAYTKSETDELISAKADKTEIPSLEGYATEEWVGQQGYLTEHQQLKTINGEEIVGTGNIVIQGGEGGGLEKVEIGNLRGFGSTDPINGFYVYDTENGGWEINSASGSTISATGKGGNYSEINVYSDRILLDSLGKGHGIVIEDGATSKITVGQGIVAMSGDTLTWNGLKIVTADELPDSPGVGKSEGGVKGEIFNRYIGEYKNTASGAFSHAEGSLTKATGAFSHTEGSHTTASGDCSHAEGGHTTASDYGAHAEGSNTIAGETYSHAEGHYNVYAAGFQHMVGVGTSDTARKNAHTITKDGKHYIKGIGGYTGTETDLTDIKDLATVINEKGEGVDAYTKTETDVLLSAKADVTALDEKVNNSSIWTGTEAEWDVLSEEQKASYIIALIR